MSDLQTFIDQAWAEHADDAAAVALRLPRVLDSVSTESELLALARLAHHVYGAHLAAWADGLKYLAALARGPAFDVHGASGQALLRLRAGLALAAGSSDLRPTLSPGDRITVSAQTASALCLHDVDRAAHLLQEALAEAGTAALADADPATRALAVSTHNLAVTLQELPTRSSGQTALMLQAAEASRHWWARAGGWLEAERAEHCLSGCWLAAGDPAQARQHALNCLAIVGAQADAPALELFFGQHALALAERAAGSKAEQAQALVRMQQAFERLSTDDQAWCRASLDQARSLSA